MQRRPEVEGKIETYVEISGTGWDFELTAEVEYRVNAYDPGNICGPPERCYPPEGGEIEVLQVTLDTWEKHDPRASNDVTKKIKDKIKHSAEVGDLSDEIYEDAARQVDNLKEMEVEAKQGRLFAEAM